MAAMASVKRCSLPQRSRRLSASGMHDDGADAHRARARLKEADAFQRLVSAPSSTVARAPYRLKEADAFQRLVCKLETV